jgi:hypothetical protein
VKGLADLDAADFHACVGQEVDLRTEDGSVRATVRSVDVRGPGWERSEAFSVLFAGPEDTPLAQGTFGLGHPSLPEVEILLVPVGRDQEGGLLYEAIFN